MKKYLILAMLPILFQNALYGADLNKVLQQQFISARNVMRIHVKLELDPVLQSLVSFSQKGKVEKAAAIARIKDIKTALEKYRSAQDLSWISWLRGATPQIVKNQIDPALAKVNKTLAMVTQWKTSDYLLVAGGVTLALVALFGAKYALDKFDKKEPVFGVVLNADAYARAAASRARSAGSAFNRASGVADLVKDSFGEQSDAYTVAARAADDASNAADNAALAADDAQRAAENSDVQAAQRAHDAARMYCYQAIDAQERAYHAQSAALFKREKAFEKTLAIADQVEVAAREKATQKSIARDLVVDAEKNDRSDNLLLPASSTSEDSDGDSTVSSNSVFGDGSDSDDSSISVGSGMQSASSASVAGSSQLLPAESAIQKPLARPVYWHEIYSEHLHPKLYAEQQAKIKSGELVPTGGGFLSTDFERIQKTSQEKTASHQKQSSAPAKLEILLEQTSQPTLTTLVEPLSSQDLLIRPQTVPERRAYINDLFARSEKLHQEKLKPKSTPKPTIKIPVDGPESKLFTRPRKDVQKYEALENIVDYLQTTLGINAIADTHTAADVMIFVTLFEDAFSTLEKSRVIEVAQKLFSVKNEVDLRVKMNQMLDVPSLYPDQDLDPAFLTQKFRIQNLLDSMSTRSSKSWKITSENYDSIVSSLKRITKIIGERLNYKGFHTIPFEIDICN